MSDAGKASGGSGWLLILRFAINCSPRGLDPAWEPFSQLDAIWIENRAMAAYACTRNLIMPLET